ncbi:MAG TPA: transglutaminase domain-containing protein [Fimbriimonadaceae bacterium]|nr:transglutaminase domain-containing protein [Fimbriimonadaceae bacterium]
MLLLPVLLAAALGVQKGATPDQVGDGYTIVTTVKIAQPYRLADMNDEFQSARLQSESDGVGTFEITYRPFHRQNISADPNWRKDDAEMGEYLRPHPAADWTPALRKQILSDLAAAGIDPAKLDDKTLVENASAWAMRRSKFNEQFGLWMVNFAGGEPEVEPAMRQAFKENEPGGLTDQEIFDREVLGAGMYRNKTHGSCTSSSTYLATILRAVGIPTRIILTVPACDPNDPNQIKMLASAIRRGQTRMTVRMGMVSSGFVNHVFNEVWVGGKWVRLNYDRLGQPILDKDYLGLMTHVYTTLDVSEVPFPSTWGTRFALHQGPKLSSDNPYELLGARDHLEAGLALDDPPVPNLTTGTIIAVVKGGDPHPSWIQFPPGNDCLLQIKEWIPDQSFLQLRDFIEGASDRIVLHADGHPDVAAIVTGYNVDDGSGRFQAFGVHLERPLVKGVDYELQPQNTGHARVWAVAKGVVWKG